MRKTIQLLFISFVFPLITLTASGTKIEGISFTSGVVPHHLLAKEIIENFFEFVSEEGRHPETIILFSPDHFNCSAHKADNPFISVSWEEGFSELAGISVDFELLKKLTIHNDIALDRKTVLTELGITNLLPFIKKYLPEAKIIPLIIAADTSRKQVDRLVYDIHKKSYQNTFMIASVDFSHYLLPEAAALHDVKSIRVLLNFEKECFENIEVDSWQALYAIRLFAKLRESEKASVIAHKNSIDILPYDMNSTTSYFSAIFQKGAPPEILQSETILLTGDMMLGRGIKELIKQNSVYYPFQKIVQLLRGVDIVFANLEGPVLENPPELGDAELKFSFLPNVLEGVKWSQINLVSLANNHTLDMGEKGLKETKNWLKEYQINFVDTSFSGLDNERKIPFYSKHTVFLSFNRVLPYIDYRKEIIKEIEKIRQANPEKIIVVNIHWGNEYELVSSDAQRELASAIVASGADVIVGHHPHVVQEIGLIQDRPVFYSLGNFIFDQHFLPETQEGLLVGLTVKTDRITCHLFPIKNCSGQPILMNEKERKIFLKNLAQKSDKRL